MKKYLCLFAVSAFMTFSQDALATTITFSDLPTGNCRGIGFQASSQGFNFIDRSGGTLFMCNGGVVANNISPGLLSAGARSDIEFSSNDGSLFSLQSFSAGSRGKDFDPSQPSQFFTSTGMNVTGFTSTGSVSQSFNFSGRNFDQFFLDPSFVGLSSVRITALGSALAPEFLIDDIVVSQVASVPEPSTWAMMVFGLGFIGTSIRRNRRQSRLFRFA